MWLIAWIFYLYTRVYMTTHMNVYINTHYVPTNHPIPCLFYNNYSLFYFYGDTFLKHCIYYFTHYAYCLKFWYQCSECLQVIIVLELLSKIIYYNWNLCVYTSLIHGWLNFEKEIWEFDSEGLTINIVIDRIFFNNVIEEVVYSIQIKFHSALCLSKCIESFIECNSKNHIHIWLFIALHVLSPIFPKTWAFIY